MYLLTSVLSLGKKNKAMHNQLVEFESQLRYTKSLLYQSENKLAKEHEIQITPPINQNELLTIEKNNEELKNEIKRLNEEILIKNQEYKELESTHIDKLYHLTNEKDALMSQIRETKSNISKVITLQTKLQFAEQEIEKLTKQIEANKSAFENKSESIN